MNKLAIWKSVLDDQRDHIDELEFRNPAAIILYRMLLAACIVALFVSFIVWEIDIHTRNAYDAGQRDLYEAMDLEHEQMMAAAAEAELQAQQAEEALQIRERALVLVEDHVIPGIVPLGLVRRAVVLDHGAGTAGHQKARRSGAQRESENRLDVHVT